MYISVIGRVGHEPEKRMTPNGKELYTVSIAYTDYAKKEKETVWVKVTLSKMFENVIPYIKKGSKIFVNGKMSAPNVSQKTGKAYIDVYASHIELLDKKEEQAPQQPPQSFSTPTFQPQTTPQRESTGAFGDIPF